MSLDLFKNKWLVSLTALFCCALWGISTPIVKLGYEFLDKYDAFTLILWAGVQFVLAGLIIIVFYSIFIKRLVFPERKSIKRIASISLLQTILQYSLLYIGLMHTTSVKGAILKCTDVFFIMLIASLIFRQEKITATKLISCIIGFAGIIVINLNGLTFSVNLLGDGLVLMAIISYSFSAVLIKRYCENENPITLCGYQMMIGGAVMTLIGVVFGGTFNFEAMFPIILCLSIAYALAYSLWTVLLKCNSVSRVSIHSFITPIIGVVSSNVILSEKSNVSTINIIIALVLVCIGIIMWSVKQNN